MYTSQLSEPMQLGFGNYPLIHNGQTTNKNIRHYWIKMWPPFWAEYLDKQPVKSAWVAVIQINMDCSSHIWQTKEEKIGLDVGLGLSAASVIKFVMPNQWTTTGITCVNLDNKNLWLIVDVYKRDPS